MKCIFTNNSMPFFSIMVVLCIGIFPGCKDDKKECRRNSDCATDEICQKGECRVNPFVILDTGSQADTATQIADSNRGSDTVNDSASDADSTTTTDSDSASTAENKLCLSNGDCDDGNPCTMDFCNLASAPYQCDATALADGDACDDGDPCNGNDVCQSGVCTSSEPPCNNIVQIGECTTYVATCNPNGDELCTYTTASVDDGTVCTAVDACFEGTCKGGKCVNAINPCSVNNLPCVISTCVPSGKTPGDYACNSTVIPDGNTCRVFSEVDACAVSEESPYYSDGYCYTTPNGPTCILGNDRACFNGTLPNICTAQVCMPADGSCMDIPQTDVSVHGSCGDTVTLTAANFVTREYYRYPQPCDPIDARGMEVALTLDLAGPTDVTVSVTNSGGQQISLHHLADMCDPATCQSNNYDSLSVTGMAPTDAVLVEAGVGLPPEGIQLSITCN